MSDTKLPSAEESVEKLFRLLGVDVNEALLKSLRRLALDHLLADRRAVLKAAAEVADIYLKAMYNTPPGLPLIYYEKLTELGAEIRKLGESP